MSIDLKQYSAFLEQCAKELDIPPSKYQQAVDRYQSVGQWLEKGEYESFSGNDIKIYAQGSFRLGTVVRPLKNGVEAEYDIDLVSEMPIRKKQTNAKHIKTIVGNRLKESGKYKSMLGDEGKRCWTLNYSEQDGIGFHMDILPSVLENQLPHETAIAITDKKKNSYTWSASNPNGYAAWFEEKNRHTFNELKNNQKIRIYTDHLTIYASIDDVPDQLVRTPLQCVIQIMKRHRDMRFNDSDNFKYRPISMIITTLAAHLYDSEADIFSALQNIVNKLLSYNSLLKSQLFLEDALTTLTSNKLIYRKSDGSWYIGNPVNPEENFADRWHEDDDARAKAFFQWIDWIKNDLIEIVSESDPHIIKKTLSSGIGKSFVNKHFCTLGLMVSPSVIASPRHIHITEPVKPWRC